MGEAAIDQHVDGHALIAFADGVVVHLADRDFTVVDQRAAVERAQIVGVQVDHQLAGVQAVLRLGIERGEVGLLLAAAGHHADIVAADQRIEAGDPGQRGLGVTSQNWVPSRSESPRSLLMLASTTMLRRSLLRLIFAPCRPQRPDSAPACGRRRCPPPIGNRW